MCLTCKVALIGENSDLVHQVTMYGQHSGMNLATSQTYSWFNQVTTASNQDQTSFRSCGVLQVARPRPLQVRQSQEAAGDLVGGCL